MFCHYLYLISVYHIYEQFLCLRLIVRGGVTLINVCVQIVYVYDGVVICVYLSVFEWLIILSLPVDGKRVCVFI